MTLYVLKGDWGEYLQLVRQDAGSLIFSYTKNFHDALQMDKATADYYCEMKGFFTKIKLAG